MKYLLCLLTGHRAGQWSAWSSYGRGRLYRTRFCTRCERELVQIDGKR